MMKITFCKNDSYQQRPTSQVKGPAKVYAKESQATRLTKQQPSTFHVTKQYYWHNAQTGLQTLASSPLMRWKTLKI